MNTQKSGKTFGISTKLLYVLVSAGVFLALALTKTVEFTSSEVMTLILGIAGLGIGGHTVTDVASMFKRDGFTTAVLKELAEPVRLPSASRSPSNDRVTPIETPIPKGVPSESDSG